jgi:NitT/TauT family transport system permease protein
VEEGISLEVYMSVPQWLFVPNRVPRTMVLVGISIAECALLLLLWSTQTSPLIQGPTEVFDAYPTLFAKGLGYHLKTSFVLFAQAMVIATVLSLGCAYVSRFALGYPIATAVGKLRFIGFTGLTFLFTITVGGGHPLKLALLVFGITVFFTVGMVSVVRDIPEEQLDHARTLKMGEWQVLWEVVVLGTLDEALELMRQNAAIGWMMLTMVEGLSRTEGGIGVMLLNDDKTFNMAGVFAIQSIILAIGILLDYGLGVFRNLCCPHVARAHKRG